jgi:hypothetical protein
MDVVCTERNIDRITLGSFNHHSKRIGNSWDRTLNGANIPEFEVALCMYQLSMQYVFILGSQDVAEVETHWLKAYSRRWGHLSKETHLEIIRYHQMFKLSIVFSFSNSRTIHYLETVEQTIILA